MYTLSLINKESNRVRKRHFEIKGRRELIQFIFYPLNQYIFTESRLPENEFSTEESRAKRECLNLMPFIGQFLDISCIHGLPSYEMIWPIFCLKYLGLLKIVKCLSLATWPHHLQPWFPLSHEIQLHHGDGHITCHHPQQYFPNPNFKDLILYCILPFELLSFSILTLICFCRLEASNSISLCTTLSLSNFHFEQFGFHHPTQ